MKLHNVMTGLFWLACLLCVVIVLTPSAFWPFRVAAALFLGFGLVWYWLEPEPVVRDWLIQAVDDGTLDTVVRVWPDGDNTHPGVEFRYHSEAVADYRDAYGVMDWQRFFSEVVVNDAHSYFND